MLHPNRYILIFIILLITGCNEVTSSMYVCKGLTEENIQKLSNIGDLVSTRELVRLYVECNDNQTTEYHDLALFWSEKLVSFKDATNEDLKVYRALRDLDVETGKPIE
jgi:hypothetical protein